jgi:hypothetical protein
MGAISDRVAIRMELRNAIACILQARIACSPLDSVLENFTLTIPSL